MTAQGDRTKDLLIRATTTLVAQVGYHQATTRAIAKHAGVAEGTLYRHFPDKRSLFSAAVLAGHQPVLDWMADLPGRAGTASVVDTLTDCLAQLWQLRASVLPLELALAADPDAGGPGPAENTGSVASLVGPPLLLARYLAAEQQLGRVRRELDPAHLAVVLLATLFGLAMNPAARSGTTEPDDAERAVLRSAVTLLAEGFNT